MSAEVTALIERFDHLRNSGVCSPTTRALLDDAQSLLTALSTPPADNVREALIEDVAIAAADWRNGADRTSQHAPSLAEYVAKVIGSSTRYEVRPRGTVTEPCPICNWTGPSPQFDIDGVAVHHPSHEPRKTATDAEVEAAAWALLDRGMDLADRSPSQQVFEEAKADARAVLEAAREARS